MQQCVHCHSGNNFGIVMWLKSEDSRLNGPINVHLLFTGSSVWDAMPLQQLWVTSPKKKKKEAAGPACRTFRNARNLLSTIIFCQWSPLSYVSSPITWLSEALSRSSLGFKDAKCRKGPRLVSRISNLMGLRLWQKLIPVSTISG